MKARVLVLFLLLATIILMTGGCSTTLVESLPLGKTTRCDASWPGRWKAMEQNRGRAYQDEWLQINSDCSQLTFTDSEKTQTEQHTLTLISTRAGDFLTFYTPGDKQACFGDANSHCGTELIRYVRTGDTIQLFRPDHRSVHEALQSHLISGYTEMNISPSTPTATGGTQTDQAAVPIPLIQSRAIAEEDDKKEPTFHNLIAGDPDQIAQILKQHPEFFEAMPWMILKREGPMNAGSQP